MTVRRGLPADLQERLARRVAIAERQTRAQIVTVVARQASPTGIGLLLAGALIALALPGLVWAGGLVEDFPRLYLGQLGILLLFVLLHFCSPMTRLLVPRRRRRVAASALAADLFVRLGLGHSGGRGGVLLLVALAERHVEVIADHAAELAVPADTWEQAVAIFRREAEAGDLDGAFALTLSFIGDRLGRALPRLPSDRSQPSERLLLI